MTQNIVQLVPIAEVREARTSDVDHIFSLLELHAERGIILPRSKANILNDLTNFSVIEIQGRIAACGALEIFTKELCEVRSLVVHTDFEHQGLGRHVVNDIFNRAKGLGLSRIMALTYVPEFFHRLGFHTVPKETFPEKIWGVCFKCSKFNDCNEIAVLKYIH